LDVGAARAVLAGSRAALAAMRTALGLSQVGQSASPPPPESTNVGRDR
jgi:hypothetical protein